MEKIWDFFSGIFSWMKETETKYKQRCDNMSAEEREKEMEKRMDAYKALCLGGLTSMYWKDTTALLTKVKNISEPFSVALSEVFAVYQGGMLLGLAAASFHKSSPWSVAVASNGSLFAVLFNIAAFHLEIFEFVPSKGLLASWIVLSLVFSVYWYFSSQDLLLINFLLKLVHLIWSCVKFILWNFIYLPLSYFIHYWCLASEYIPVTIAFGIMTNGNPDARRLREEAEARRAREEAEARRAREALRNRHRGEENV